jgi:dienelactone hydrolase
MTQHFQILGSADKPICIDLTYPSGEDCDKNSDKTASYPLLVFMHGFKGFKDWGHWQLLAEKFAQAGFAFLKFNFSHNGTTPDAPTEFIDLDTFGENTYTRELFDANQVLTWIHSEPMRGIWAQHNIDIAQLGLIGHSRGGGIALLTARAHSDKVKAVATWASVSDLGWSWLEKTAEQIETWRKDGLIYTSNMRTRQKMPLNFSLYADYEANRSAYSLQNAVAALDCPLCILHGDEDVAVPMRHAHDLAQYAKADTPLVCIAGANHVFGGTHPYLSEELSTTAQELWAKTAEFFAQKIG